MLLQTSTPVLPGFLESSKFHHRLQKKLAENKRLLLQEKFSGLVLDSATNIDVAVVEHSLQRALCLESIRDGVCPIFSSCAAFMQITRMDGITANNYAGIYGSNSLYKDS